MHAAVAVHERAFLLGDVGDGERDRGLPCDGREHGAEVNQRAVGLHHRIGVVEDQHHRGRLGGRHGGGVRARVAQQFSTFPVRSALGAQREVGDPRQRRLVAHDHLEGTSPLERGERPPGEEQRLGRRPRGNERDGGAARALQDLARPVQRLVPIGGAQLAAVPDQRRLDTVAAVHPAVVRPAVIAHEVAVHVEVGAGPHPHHHVLAGVEGHVAALRAARADRGRLV